MNTKIDWHYHLSGRNIKQDSIELEKYIKDKNMDNVYVMATYFPENGSGVSNFNVYHHIKNIKKTKMYISLDFENYYFMGINEIETMLSDNIIKEKIIGIKIYTGYQNIDLNSDKFNKIMQIAENNNLYVMFHTGYLKGNKTNFNPISLDEVISKYFNITFIIAHLGNPFINESIYLLNKHENLYTDISGLVDKRVEINDTMKRVEKLYNGIGKIDNKILFGTDFPMQDYDTTLIFSELIK